MTKCVHKLLYHNYGILTKNILLIIFILLRDEVHSSLNSHSPSESAKQQQYVAAAESMVSVICSVNKNMWWPSSSL